MTEKQHTEAEGHETAKLPPMKVAPKLVHWSETKDDRRNKDYHRKLRFGVSLLFRDHEAHRRATCQVYYQDDGDSPLGYIHQAVREAMDGQSWPRAVKAYSHAGHFRPVQATDNGGYEFEMTFVYGAIFYADKPSQILSEDDCIAALGGIDKLHRIIAEAINRGLEKAATEKKVYERARIASLMLGDYKERVEQRALKNVRWEQRYAAFVAEYKAELEIQTAELLAEMGDSPGVTWKDSPGYDERSTSAAKAALPEAIAKMGSPAEQSGFFHGSGQSKLAVDIDAVR